MSARLEESAKTSTATSTAKSATASAATVVVRDLGATNYADTFEAMKAFTDQRGPDTLDEIWLTEHNPVFTQGQAGKEEHLLFPGDIPVIQSDRGGQVTYHGPGQITGYLLFDLRRMGLSVRGLVSGIENSIIALLSRYDITAAARPDAPGVYIGNNKIASLGLRVRRGCSYHGLALNVDMDLEPFGRINPCGLTGIDVVDMASMATGVELAAVQQHLLAELAGTYGLAYS